jgi:rubrerythrin
MGEKACTMSKDSILFNLKQGLEAEQKALAICQEIKKQLFLIRDEEDKVKIDKIIADENKHIKIVNRLMEIVEKHVD